MALKVQVIYNQNSRGWTETYYTTSTSQPSAWLSLYDQSAFYPLVAFRSQATSLYGVRVSNIGTSRVSSTSIFTGNRAISGTGIATNLTGPDVASTDAFFDFYADNGARRPIYLRGINETDVNISATGLSVPGANLLAGVNKMVGALGNLGLCIQVQNRPPAGGILWTYVTEVTAQGNNSVLTCGSNPGQPAAPTYQYVAQGIPHDDMPGFPRILTPIATNLTANPPTITIPYRLRVSGGLTYNPAKLRFTQLAFSYYPITDYTFVRFSSRKTGRPTGVPRGRSRPAVRAQ